jgi:hypothetical protein
MLTKFVLVDDVRIRVQEVHIDGQISLLPLVSSLLDIQQSLVLVMAGHVHLVQLVLM